MIASSPLSARSFSAIRRAPATACADSIAGMIRADRGDDAMLLINLSGRGDKDMDTAIEWFGLGDPDQVTEEPVGQPGEDLT